MSELNPDSLKYTTTTCSYCGVGCGLNLVSRGNELIGVEPFKRSPINEGKLCPKGTTCWETVQKPGRLTKPLIKKGDKFEEASWDEAIDLITKKFSEAHKQGG
ncbi:MAG: formate dehydrogenase subunit alpha, partial [Methanomicrobiales archaeon HGW-Methanomicrobiales-5]